MQGASQSEAESCEGGQSPHCGSSLCRGGGAGGASLLEPASACSRSSRAAAAAGCGVCAHLQEVHTRESPIAVEQEGV